MAGETSEGIYRVGGFHTTVFVDRAKSWALASAKQANVLLPHEQGHYDITGLVAREVTRKMLDLSFDDSILIACPTTETGKTPASRMKYVGGEFTKAIAQIGQDAKALLNRLQSNGGNNGLYDTQTANGTNAAQTRWTNVLERLKGGYEDLGYWLQMGWI